jgi:hypothetical protein
VNHSPLSPAGVAESNRPWIKAVSLRSAVARRRTELCLGMRAWRTPGQHAQTSGDQSAHRSTSQETMHLHASCSLAATLRTGALARRVRADGPVVAVHGGRADLGRVYGGAGRQPPESAGSRLATWNLGAASWATVGASLARGIGHGPVGALVSAWPALALVGSFELLMMLIGTGRDTRRIRPNPSLSARPRHPGAGSATGAHGMAPHR